MINAAAEGLDAPVNTEEADILEGLSLRCPSCRTIFPKSSFRTAVRMTCSQCGFLLAEEGGIIRALTAAGKRQFEEFARDYKVVRGHEGWGSTSADYYLALPFQDVTHQHEWIWNIRARTWLYIDSHLLREFEGSRSGIRVLDIGAGNGWLSYRMAQRGYRAVAVDLLDEEIDGLGAARHYLAHLRRTLPRFQAEMDHLPFDDAQFEVAIFNASFHYSLAPETTLREAMRCVRTGGLVIIADSPFYRRDESGARMLEERGNRFEKDFGLACEKKQNLEYLTPKVLSGLAETFSIRWNVEKPWYGLSWAMRPVKARLLRRREPSKFYIWWFRLPK